MFNIEGFSSVKEEELEEVFGGGYLAYVLTQAINSGCEVHVTTSFEGTQTSNGSTTFTQTTTVTSQGVTGVQVKTGTKDGVTTTETYSSGNS